MFLHLSADKQQKEVWSSRLQKWLHERFGVYMEDFRFQPEESTVEAEEPLSAKRWVSFVLTTSACLSSSVGQYGCRTASERTAEDGGTFLLF